MAKPRHTVRLTVEVEFEGTYYEPREMVNLVDGWFSDALDDRSDVRGYHGTGTVAIKWTGDNIDAVTAFMDPDEPMYVNSLSELRFTNADELVGVNTPDGLKVARIGDSIARFGDHLTVLPRDTA